ncbi:MAG: lysophospholipid acyltransferase family protein [Akkermansiaceae bacterium]
MADALEIRGTTKQRVIGKLAGGLIRVMGWTLRYRYEGLEQMSGKLGGRPVIFALWHNRIFAMPYAKPKLSPDREVCVLTSASKDGAILETAVRSFGLTAVRGSSSRRGAAALVALRRKLTSGATVTITPDGPKGPRYKVQPGVVKLAQASGAPIVVVSVNYSRCWRFKSWDRFCLPKPFSKVMVRLEEGVEISKELSNDAFEDERMKLEVLMNESVRDEPE